MLAMCRGQNVDLFGEIAGIAFSPDSDRMFVGIADLSYPTFIMLDRRSVAKQLPYACGPEALEDTEPEPDEVELPRRDHHVIAVQGFLQALQGLSKVRLR
jgi:hypothetical protein